MTAHLRVSLLALLAGACTDFDRVDRNLCGNAIVEPARQEDCDGASIQDLTTAYACGAPSTPQQCRLLCNTEGRTCPDGWACNLEDGICRESLEGIYEVSESLRLDRLGRVTSANLDADGRSDVLATADDRGDGSGRLTVFHFDAAGGLDGEPSSDPSATKLRSPLVAGALGSQPARKADNVSVLLAPGYAPGLLAMRGRRDRTLLSALGAQFTGMGSDAFVLPLVRQSEDGSFGYVAVVGDARTVQLNGGLLEQIGGYEVNAPLMFGLRPELDGALPAPHVAVGALSPSTHPGLESLVLAVAGESGPRVYDPFFPDPWKYRTIVLPEGVRVPADGGAWLGDVNGDALLDLLVAGDDSNTYFAYGVGSFAFSSSLDLAEPDYATGAAAVIQGAHPLAVGNLDDDAYADFVFSRPYGIALSKPSVGFTLVTLVPCPQLGSALAPGYVCSMHGAQQPGPPSSMPEWSQARLQDLNFDERLDVIAASKEANEIAILYMSDENTFSAHRLETTGRPTKLTFGDLDRDFIFDLGFVVDAGDHDEVYVSLARMDGGPVPPRLLFEVPSVLGIEQGGFMAWRNEHDEVFVSMALGGVSDERLLSPNVISCPSLGEPASAPQQLVMGRFDDRDGLDAALVYHNCFGTSSSDDVDRLVLYPAGERGATAAVVDRPWVTGACPPPQDLLSCKQARDAFIPTSVELDTVAWSKDALVVPIDLSPGDDRDELVMLAGRELLVADLDPNPPGLPRFRIVARGTIDVPAGGDYDEGWRGKAAAVDADADGDLDILLLTSEPVPRLVVLENDDGSLRTTARPLTFAVAPPGVLHSFAMLDADYDLSADDLLVAADSKIYLALDAYSGSAAAQPIAVSTTVDAVIDELIAADFNGDGLTDLAVVRGESIEVLKNLPANP